MKGVIAMADITNVQSEDENISVEFSDEALEAAALAKKAGAYTQFGLCTVSLCPGVRAPSSDNGETATSSFS
jgi:hypothetical protein